MKIERLILKNLLENPDYIKRVLPYLKDEYFDSVSERKLFLLVNDYYTKYNNSPKINELQHEVGKIKGITQETFEECKNILDEVQGESTKNNLDWLVDTTEKFCQEKAIYLAMLHSMEILNGTDKKHSNGEIPNILTKALAVNFDPDIGHDYLVDFGKQFDFYHKAENRVTFDLEMFNTITNGGLPDKSLTVLLAGVHVGKTLTMCHLASGFLAQGYNVLYITLEMGTEHIVHRIDANLMNIGLEDIKALPQESYYKKADLLKGKTNGKLIVKEYPTTTATSAHFSLLLDELKMKKGFVPHVVFVDYINLCASSRFKHGGGAGMYEYVKGVAEELRGIAGIFKTRVITATQVNRQGFAASDPDMTNTAESFGLPATADFMLALVSNEQLEQLGQLKVIQLKNRFGDFTKNRVFLIGIDRMKMKLFDLRNATQGLIIPDILPKANSAPDDKFRKLII